MTVYLVGAGPGDPGLLTVRGAELLAAADVVVFDRLSARELLALAPDHAERIDVGKSPDGPSVPQERINELLVERGRRGGTVVRLKGGDPFVFARGAEEAHALAAAGVPYEVVPGITSAIAVPAYAGIPVTMRYSSTSLTVVTGHEDPTKATGQVDWHALARVGGTIVVLMGVANLAEISRRLIEGGLAPDTPAAAVRWGTRADQQVTRATLADLHTHPLRAPSTIVIGEVAGEQLDWFTRRPLLGRSVVVTRTPGQASKLSRRLADQGAQVIGLPTIAVVDPVDGGAALRQGLASLRPGDWLVLTSANGAERVLGALHDVRDLAGVQLAVVGPGTASVLTGAGLRVDLVPERYVAEGLLAEFPDPPAGGGRVVLARAQVARDVLPDGLAARGWRVEVLDAYRTVPAELDADELDRARGADAITFTSASSVRNFVAAAGLDALPPTVVTIGPITSAAATELGVSVSAEAVEHTLDGLVQALVGALPPA